MKGLVLDLFAGTGSATEPFVECGRHRVVRADIEMRPGINFRVNAKNLPSFLLRERAEFIWASPPCDDLTDVPWNEELREPSRGIALFQQAIEIINVMHPKKYCIENVRGAQRFVGPANMHRGSRYLWTDIDILPEVPKCYGKWRIPPSPERKMLRSAIPGPLARAFHHVMCDGATT